MESKTLKVNVVKRNSKGATFSTINCPYTPESSCIINNNESNRGLYGAKINAGIARLTLTGSGNQRFAYSIINAGYAEYVYIFCGNGNVTQFEQCRGMHIEMVY